VTAARDFYDAGYSLAGPAEAATLGRWRALGAASKADHAAALCERAGLRPRTLVEIGCGDGALLVALGQRGVAPKLDGFELSERATAIAAARQIAGVRRIEAYDGARVPAADGAYDLAVLSHVLEHVPDPPALLREAARVAANVLVEVPLEANRSAARPAKRAEAARIGHLHAFDRGAVRRLVHRAGLRAAHELTDPLPYEHHAFFGARRRAAAKWAARRALHAVNETAAERLFTLHYAVLATRA
jgi:SAM-dependent methyltransferase